MVCEQLPKFGMIVAGILGAFALGTLKEAACFKMRQTRLLCHPKRSVKLLC
jgi:hypothetical protein